MTLRKSTLRLPRLNDPTEGTRLEDIASGWGRCVWGAGGIYATVRKRRELEAALMGMGISDQQSETGRLFLTLANIGNWRPMGLEATIFLFF